MIVRPVQDLHSKAHKSWIRSCDMILIFSGKIWNNFEAKAVHVPLKWDKFWYIFSIDWVSLMTIHPCVLMLYCQIWYRVLLYCNGQHWITNCQGGRCICHFCDFTGNIITGFNYSKHFKCLRSAVSITGFMIPCIIFAGTTHDASY